VRGRLRVGLLTLALLAMPGIARTPVTSAATRPNIVLILTDDQRFDELAQMPTVHSELVSQGMTFSNGFVVNPLCCPSRATILTGQYSHSTQMYDNNPPYGGFQTFRHSHEDRSTIATWLDTSGYDTGLVGKYLNGYGPKTVAYTAPGWDTWNVLAMRGHASYFDYTMSIDGTPASFGSAPADYSTDVLASDAVRFIQNAPATKPLFLYFAPSAPHPPATPPPRYANAFPDFVPGRPPNYNEADVSDKPPYIQAKHPWSPTNRSQQDALHRRQLQSLLAVDDAVERIVDALRATGRLDDTLIVLAGDNGLAIGEHRWAGKKIPYEESIHIPLVVRYDPVTHHAASTNADLVLNLDFAPTFAAAGGVSAPGVEGKSFLPLLSGTGRSWRSIFLIKHANSGTNIQVPAYCGVRETRYVYVKYADGFEELYNLSADPYQLKNLLVTNPGGSVVVANYDRLHSAMLQLCQPPPPGFTL